MGILVPKNAVFIFADRFVVQVAIEVGISSSNSPLQ